jgi:hypothetical protein
MTGKAVAQSATQSPAPYGLREDGTPKGLGYFGLLPSKDGKHEVSTELSADVDIGGKKMFFPLLVPTLTRDEIDLLLSGAKPTDSIYEKAIRFAQERIKAGKSPFAGPGEQRSLPKTEEDGLQEGYETP